MNKEPDKSPSDTEVNVDLVLTHGTANNFTEIDAGGPARTSHLNRKRAAGGNDSLLDGHVSWRRFNKMTDRFGDPTVWF